MSGEEEQTGGGKRWRTWRHPTYPTCLSAETLGDGRHRLLRSLRRQRESAKGGAGTEVGGVGRLCFSQRAEARGD